jgi:hypothetical protein
MDKGFSLTTPAAISAYRLMTLKQGVKAEARGFKLTRGVNCTKLARQELGLPARTKHEEIIKAIDAKLAEMQPEAAKGITVHE